MTEQHNLATLILAAGKSSRMGSPKALLDLGGKTALQRVIELHRNAGVDNLVVVTGQWSEKIVPAARALGAKAIHNSNHKDGMFSSILTGLAALKRPAAVFVHPVDIPLVGPDTLERIIKAWSERREGVIRPSDGSRFGHPPLIDRGLIPAIEAWNGSQGLKGALRSLKDRTFIVEVDDPAIMWDMDTPGDHQRLQDHLANIPEGAEG